MLKISLLIISTSISLTNYKDSLYTKYRYESPTLSQPLLTNTNLIKEQNEEIMNSILKESIMNDNR